MRIHLLASAALLASALAFHANADAIPYPNVGNLAPTNTFTATSTGDLTVYYYGTTANYDDQLGVLVNGVAQGGLGLDNQTSSFGQVYDFGHVNAGDSIVFSLLATPPSPYSSYTLYSDPSMNFDSVNHTYTTSFSGAYAGSATIPAGVYVSFEDLPVPGSDLNYNDEDFVVTNATANATPEPASLMLFGAGAIAIGLTRKLRRQSAN